MQSNVEPIAIGHLRSTIEPLPLTEAELDRQIAENRELFEDSIDPFREHEVWKERRAERRKAQVAKPSTAAPSVIVLGPSLPVRAGRALREFFLSFRRPA